jgi:hypothetical protein
MDQGEGGVGDVGVPLAVVAHELGSGRTAQDLRELDPRSLQPAQPLGDPLHLRRYVTNLIRAARRRITFTRVCSVRSMANDVGDGSIAPQPAVGHEKRAEAMTRRPSLRLLVVRSIAHSALRRSSHPVEFPDRVRRLEPLQPGLAVQGLAKQTWGISPLCWTARASFPSHPTASIGA